MPSNRNRFRLRLRQGLNLRPLMVTVTPPPGAECFASGPTPDASTRSPSPLLVWVTRMLDVYNCNVYT